MAHRCPGCGEPSQLAWCFGCGREVTPAGRSRARGAHVAAPRPAVLAALVATVLGGAVALTATSAQAGSPPAPSSVAR